MITHKKFFRIKNFSLEAGEGETFCKKEKRK